MSHPTERDLLNFARDALRQTKRQRILAHCRDCQPCADRLLDLVRQHAPPGERLRLTWFNWLSIVVLAATLLALVGGLIWLLRHGSVG